MFLAVTALWPLWPGSNTTGSHLRPRLCKARDREEGLFRALLADFY